MTDVERPTRRLPSPSAGHSNADLFVWALELAGGREAFVDIEDVYLKCFELAPKRFSWRTREDLPDLQKISVARRDAIKKQNQSEVVLITALEADVREGKRVPAYRWRLTEAGAQWCDLHRQHLHRLYGGGSVPLPKRRPESKRLRRLRQHGLYRDWSEKGALEPSEWELADLLNCSPSSNRGVWELRIDGLVEDAKKADASEVLDFLHSVREKLGLT